MHEQRREQHKDVDEEPTAENDKPGGGATANGGRRCVQSRSRIGGSAEAGD